MNNISNFKKFLSECINKNKQSWDIFVNRFGNLIYSYIIHTLRTYNCSNKNNAVDEIFNNVFWTLLQNDCKKLKAFKGDNLPTFLAYLRTITFHKTVDFLRAQKKFINFENVEFYPTKFKSSHLEKEAFRRLVSILREGLPARQNYLFSLLYEEGLNLMEIARIMSLTPNTVSQLKFRMIQNIKKTAKKKGLYNELKNFMITPTNSQINRASILCLSEA